MKNSEVSAVGIKLSRMILEAHNVSNRLDLSRTVRIVQVEWNKGRKEYWQMLWDIFLAREQTQPSELKEKKSLHCIPIILRLAGRRTVSCNSIEGISYSRGMNLTKSKTFDT